MSMFSFKEMVFNGLALLGLSVLLAGMFTTNLFVMFLGAAIAGLSLWVGGYE